MYIPPTKLQDTEDKIRRLREEAELYGLTLSEFLLFRMLETQEDTATSCAGIYANTET